MNVEQIGKPAPAHASFCIVFSLLQKTLLIESQQRLVEIIIVSKELQKPVEDFSNNMSVHIIGLGPQEKTHVTSVVAATVVSLMSAITAVEYTVLIADLIIRMIRRMWIHACIMSAEGLYTCFLLRQIELDNSSNPKYSCGTLAVFLLLMSTNTSLNERARASLSLQTKELIYSHSLSLILLN